MLEAIVSNMPGGLHVLASWAISSKVLVSERSSMLDDRLLALRGESSTFGGRYVEMLHPDDRGLAACVLARFAGVPAYG